jgi:hypothetical protein
VSSQTPFSQGEIDAVLAAFPNLAAERWQLQSHPTEHYNCIGWAAGVVHQWWWPEPVPKPTRYWPPGVPEVRTRAAFIGAFATLNYIPCANPLAENDVEKVALYELNGLPTHMARQLADGTWTSKLGSQHDLTHATPFGVSGNHYGQPCLFLARVSTGTVPAFPP